MASIYTHHSGYKIRYYLYFPDGTKREASRYSTNRQKAQALKEEAAFIEASTRRGAVTYDELVHYKHQGFISDEDISRLAAGGRVAKTVTWDSLKKDYETFSRASHSAHNHKTSMSRLKNLEKHFGIRPIAAITVHDILDWQVKRRAEKAAVKTIKSERDVLNQMLDIAVDYGAIPFNPGRHKLLKATLKLDNARLPRALTYDEVKLMLKIIAEEKSHLLGGHIYLAALIFLFGGLRRGELCYLSTADVSREIVIQSKKVSNDETTDPDVKREGAWKPKGNRPRVIDLPPKVLKKIQKLLPGDGRFIFGGDHVYHRDYISQEFKEVLDKVEPSLSLHCLRHTFVTWRIEHGISGKGDNLVRVQLVAGHADIQTTMRYTHIKISPEKDILGLV